LHADGVWLGLEYHADMDDLSLPWVTGQQMAAVDTAMVEVCGLELLQVMEVAGRAVALVARQLWHRAGAHGTVAILCGSGGNGGDGLVCGRYLLGWGIPVELWLVRPSDEMHGLAAHQLAVCRKIGMAPVEPSQVPSFEATTTIIDGIFGFGLSAPPTGRAADLIEAANRSGTAILAIDVPSGIDASTGEAAGPAIQAAVTVTLGLPKRGLLLGAGAAHAGDVIVADIGIADAAYRAAGVPLTTVFQNSEFADPAGNPVRLTRI
jgi:NAD(P)H-hydrate epimerase